ncbi:MAG: hypothetical protein IPM01_30905 [Burkholderiaceae bacterium]|nr:hypothetical protein [Burkholderiaceae bacterium]
MDSARHLVTLGPSAVELVDRTMIDLARDNPVFRPVIEAALIGQPDAILLVEFSGDDRGVLLQRLARLVEMVADLGLPGAVVEMREDKPQKALAHVRPILDMRRGDATRCARSPKKRPAMVRQYMGAFSGEHGDGLVRSEWVAWQFGPRLTAPSSR